MLEVPAQPLHAGDGCRVAGGGHWLLSVVGHKIAPLAAPVKRPPRNEGRTPLTGRLFLARLIHAMNEPRLWQGEGLGGGRGLLF